MKKIKFIYWNILLIYLPPVKFCSAVPSVLQSSCTDSKIGKNWITNFKLRIFISFFSHPLSITIFHYSTSLTLELSLICCDFVSFANFKTLLVGSKIDRSANLTFLKSEVVHHYSLSNLYLFINFRYQIIFNVYLCNS